MKTKSNSHQWFGQELCFAEKKMKCCYRQEGNSSKYRKLKMEYRKMIKKRKSEFFNKKLQELNMDPAGWFKLVSNITRQEGSNIVMELPDLAEFKGLRTERLLGKPLQGTADLTCDQERTSHIISLRSRSQVKSAVPCYPQFATKSVQLNLSKN